MTPAAAVTVTVCCAETVAGAVYRPAALIVPSPVTVHVTSVSEALLTVAANCCACQAYSVAADGPTVTTTGGYKSTVALAVFEGSA